MFWLALVQAIHIAASILLAGMFAFRLVVLAPVASRHNCGDRFQPRFKGMWGGLALVAWLTVVVSAILWFDLVAASMSGAAMLFEVDVNTLQTVLLQTHFGRLWAFRLVGCLIVGILLFSGSPEQIIAVLSFAILASLAVAGHSGAIVVNTGPWPVFSDIGHLVAAAFWPGGLLPLLLLLLKQDRAAPQGDRMFIAEVVRRFSGLSLVVVGILVATGLLNTYFIVGSPGALFTTDYGRLLLFKIVLFILMLGLGALNLLVLKPRLSRAAMIENQIAGTAVMPAQSLIRSVAAEAFLAAVVVLVVGFLGATPPPMHM
ncbi:MAG: CopD family protein [Verrucomicrobia bacterium]|nr:CopD family protein [Verrucomicrobiota bacterium]